MILYTFYLNLSVENLNICYDLHPCMENDQSVFVEFMGDTPAVRLLDFLITGREFDYTLTDLLNAGVSWGTLNTLVPKLLELGIVVKTRKIGRATLYRIWDNLIDNEILLHTRQIGKSKLYKLNVSNKKNDISIQ